MKHLVRTPEMALAYITDCNLATVCSMEMMKRRPKHEFERQMSIAQSSVTWMQEFGIDFTGTRAQDVVEAGSVEAWVERFLEK